MKRIFTPQSKIILAVGAMVFTVVLGAGAALAQSGHFVGDVTCTDLGTQLQCCGKVAGLGGTPTFSITVEGADATASVTCTNPQWTATVTDVVFGGATITLAEGGTVSDTITAPVEPQ